MRIGDRQIGPSEPPYVIAEIGVNHDGEVSRALELTDAAAEAGADAVKVQYFETDRLMSKAAKLAAYQKAAGETDPVEMLRRLELSLDEMALLVGRAHARGIHAIVTVFSVELVEEAETLAWDAYKTASPDLVHRPLLERLSTTGKPMIVSTGASTLDEVVRAVGDDQERDGWLREARDRLAVLQCVSSYPADDEAFGGIEAISEAVRLPTGYSDHSRFPLSARYAVAFGACVLEKHITYDRLATGPDHKASMVPKQFYTYIMEAKFDGPPLRDVIPDVKAKLPVKSPFDVARGVYASSDPRFKRSIDAANILPQYPIQKRVLDCERDVREVSRQSIVATRNIAVGEVIGRGDVTFKRPGTGLLPYQLDEVLGRKAVRAIGADVPIVPADVGLESEASP